MHISVQAECGDHSQKSRFTGAGFFPEYGDFFPEPVCILFIDGKGVD
jgi:hypothetical protein